MTPPVGLLLRKERTTLRAKGNAACLFELINAIEDKIGMCNVGTHGRVRHTHTHTHTL